MNDQGPVVIRLDAEMQGIVPKYLANRAKDCDALREQAANSGFADAKRLGHNMKGTGGGYGFEEISRLGACIEAAAATGAADQLLALADELARYLARVKPVYD